MEKRNLLTEQADANDYARATAARQEFIRIKMGDVPVVYLNLLPTTAHLKTLLAAERSIRQQMASDQKLIESPWRRLAPDVSTSIFNMEGTKGEDLVHLGIETGIPLGLSDAPKPGRWSDPEVLAAFDAAKSSPEYKAGLDYSAALEEQRGAVRVFNDARISGADDETLEKLNADVVAALAKVDALVEQTPKLRTCSFNLPLSEYGKPNNWVK